MQEAGDCGLDAFIANVAAADPAVAGGSVAALAGSLAAALGEMMAGLTEGRRKFASVDLQARDIHEKLARCRDELRALIQEDSIAFKFLLDAIKLPQGAAEERRFRENAIEQAAKGATMTPLRTARTASDVLEYLMSLIEIGNPNAKCDAAMGALLAYASIKGAQYNILANIRGLRDTSFAGSCRAEISDLVQRSQKTLQQIDDMIATS
jgi:formiminotetrahydrofolate cyclodeaminase